MTTLDQLADRLATLLGPRGFTQDPSVLAPRLEEWRGRHHGRTPFMIAPATTADVAACVCACAEAGVAITPQGGNTGLVGGQIPQGEALLSLHRMTAIRAVDPIDDALIVEAGAPLVRVQEAAAAVDRLFPLSLASQGSATIGGLISTNAGGVHVLRYGMMRDLTLGLEAVLPNGEIFHGLKSLRKDNTGYDLKQLLIGAEGTLGIVTAASLKLFPRPRGHEVALCAVDDAPRAIALLHHVKARTGAVSAFEIMNRESVAMTVRNVAGRRDPFPDAPFIALIELESAQSAGLRALLEVTLTEALDAGLARDALIAETERDARAFWGLREDMSAGHKPEGAQISNDISVPVSAVARYLDEAERAVRAVLPDARIVAFGHAGDGNIHYTIVQARGGDPAAFPRDAISDAVHETAVRLGGSISAEHGIGVARRADFDRFKDPTAQALMRSLKRALDPQGLMNPRALLGPDARPDSV
ncbi:MAG: FAD-binding oxidoreductase [Hyphomonadaceae bacterium]|nr:FAD-binding oxidoreductase [Hyphomonadaceae bacterium]